MADRRLHINLPGMFGDIAVCFQKHALWRPADTVPDRFAGVAHGTASLHDLGSILEPICCGKALLGGGQGAAFGIFIGVVTRERRQPRHDDKDDNRRSPRPRWLPFACVHGVKVVPDRDAQQKHQCGDNPRVLRAERQRIVV